MATSRFQDQTFAETSQMLDALVSPWSCLGGADHVSSAVAKAARLVELGHNR